MNVPEEIKDMRDELAVARLAVAFTHLSNVPFDSWGHQGDPAEMAVLVVKDMRAQGRMSFLWESLGITNQVRRNR
jgi:hypothetical protein